MAKCDQCGAFMESAATACTWCGAGGDNGSAAEFKVPVAPALSAAAAPSISLAAAADAPEVYLPATPSLAIDPGQQNLHGIGGWLIIVGVNLALSPVSVLLSLGVDMLLLLNVRAPDVQTSSEMIGRLLLLDGLADLVLIAGWTFLNVLFYRRKKAFPRWAIAFLTGQFILAAAVHQVIVSYVPVSGSLLAFDSLLLAGIGIPYLLLSRRVKQTFVN